MTILTIYVRLTAENNSIDLVSGVTFTLALTGCVIEIANLKMFMIDFCLLS